MACKLFGVHLYIVVFESMIPPRLFLLLKVNKVTSIIDDAVHIYEVMRSLRYQFETADLYILHCYWTRDNF